VERPLFGSEFFSLILQLYCRGNEEKVVGEEQKPKKRQKEAREAKTKNKELTS